MKTHDTQSIELAVPPARAHAYVADPTHLPEWTSAFERADARAAVLRTPQGRVEVTLAVHAVPAAGTVDWEMGFPDGSTARAFSRIVALDAGRCVYCFVLTPPPGPLEQLEGALDIQSRTLSGELLTLKQILEHHA